MVVVPAFAHGQQRQPPQVPAAVPGVEAPAAEAVGHRVDGEGRVPEQDGRDAEAPDQELGAGHARTRVDPAHDRPGGQGGRSEGHRRRVVVPVEEAQLPVAGEVGHDGAVHRLVGVGEHPQQVALHEPVDHRRVRVARPVRVPVVVPVVGHPPQRPALGGRGRHGGAGGLDRARHPERAVGQAPVVHHGDAERPHCIEQRGHGERDGAPAHERDGQQAEVDHGEGHAQAHRGPTRAAGHPPRAGGATAVRRTRRAGAGGHAAVPAPAARRTHGAP